MGVILSDKQDAFSCVRIDKEGKGQWIRWVGKKEATEFESASEAIEAFREALASMRDICAAKAERANAKGGKPVSYQEARKMSKWSEWNDLASNLSTEEKSRLIEGKVESWASGRGVDANFREFGKIRIIMKAEDYLPEWSKVRNVENCVIPKQIHEPKLSLEGIDIWAARKNSVWLKAGELIWATTEILAEARMFPDEDSARRTLEALSAESFTLVRMNIRPLAVVLDEKPNAERDEEGLRLSALLEAKDLNTSITSDAGKGSRKKL